MSLEPKNQDIELELQLGDIIHITNPVNENLNDQTFFIDYIDKSKAYLINTDTLNKIKIKISEDGILGDGNISKIAILRRANTPSFARQNELLPGKWIKIVFGDPDPAIIVGEITNLEEDMIELTTSDEDIIYINFDYKGIPENLPIELIQIIDKPIKPLEEEIIKEDLEAHDLEVPELEKEKQVINVDQLQVMVPVKDVKEQLREIIIRADQIVFGDEQLGKVKQYIDVASRFERYSIDNQVADLLDELLSTVPNAQRTPKVLNNIHLMIERFKQLREKFSSFDEYGNVKGINLKEASYKPLKEWLYHFNLNLYWILPIVKNIKKIYNVEGLYEENNDILNLTFNEDFIKIKEIIGNYISNDLPSDINKYTNLYSELAPYFRPFEYQNTDETNDIIYEQNVQANINTVIDNLEDFYSSVFTNNMIRSRRFVISKYTLGDTKLDATDITSSKMTTVRVNINSSDLLSIKSIMTLPEPTIRFSRINLPNTDILTKSNLNNIFLNYWELLKKKTTSSNVFIESFENPLELNENEFVNGIRNYVLNMPAEETRGMSKTDIYSKYVESIVPKTRILFNLMKKYITGKLSIIDVVSYLEPFLIYTDDLTYNQYLDICKFIDEKVSDYNKNMIKLSRVFTQISKIKKINPDSSKAFSIIEILSNKLKDEVLETGYSFQQMKENFTNSEILRKIMLKDYSHLYTSALSYQNLELMFPKDISEIFEIEQKSKKSKLQNEDDESNKCETITISKMYNSLERLQNDNDAIIFFDKRYDKTNYGLMEEEGKKGGYAEMVIKLTPEKLKEHIVLDQMKRNNLSEFDANYLAETLIDGNKKVIDGQYALLYKGFAENIKDEVDYYIRKDNKWVLDEELSNSMPNIDDSSILCDLQEKCINVSTKTDDKCESIEKNELSLQNSLLTNIISEFDSKYKISNEEFKKVIKERFEYFLSIMPIVSKIETNELLKYNNQKFKLGVTVESDMHNQIISPFTPILDVILSQNDFVKKQRDILQFINKFTRPNIPGLFVDGKLESKHWLYCIKTGAPLIPTFKKELAAAFTESQYVYQTALEKIKATNGQLSDDGDWWTDKYTGWPICPGDFDVEEGYDEGFKIVSRAVMEEDAGNKILSSTTEKTIKYITPETIMINNIINALSIGMGINIETQKEFIINSVIETIKATVETESDYKEKIKSAAEKGKRIPSYRDFFNTSLLYYTLGMYLIAVQTIIPSIKTRKTHPGCVRSFTGYPFDGQTDLSSLIYLACVTYDIRDSGEPWNVLKKTTVEKIQNKIKLTIDDVLIQLPEVQRKFAEKTQYLLTSPPTEIAQEHDISKWSDFLPPIIPFKIKHLNNISEEFKKSLANDLRSGNLEQREKILVIESKIIQFSLAIQEKIQDIVKNHRLLLHTSNNEPYLENACCDSKENEPTITYFTNRSSDIIEFNNIVQRLTNILDDIRDTTESAILYSNINTKNIYPSIDKHFDEKTIYIAFIFYCKFKSLVPIPQDLLPLCTDKPDSNLINPLDSIGKIIQKLKEDGRNYTDQQFLRLIQLISRENIIKIELDNPIISCIAKLSELLEAIYDENNEDEIVEQSLVNLIKDAIDTFDIAREESTPQVKNLNNFLIRANEEMTKEIVEFIENNGKNINRSKTRHFINAINNLSNWSPDSSNRNEDIKISNDTMYNIINFFKTFIDNFINVFPNIILNKVNYDKTYIPKYYNFSHNHEKKLIKHISDYFEGLKKFYGVPALLNILPTIQKLGKNLVVLSRVTPCFSSIKNGDKILRGVIDERTSRFLFEYYLLRILITYIYLCDNPDMIVTEVKTNIEVTDIFSVDYIEENETRVDLGISSRNIVDTRILTGNKKVLKEKIAELLVAFMDIFEDEKNNVNISYEEIQDSVFKLREREKDMVTDKLKSMTDEARNVDNVFKILKQGIYSKGLEKGLTMYDKDFYERPEEQDLRNEMEKAERKIRKRNRDATDENIDILVDEYLEQKQMENDIDQDAYDIGFLNETYYDGGFDGVDAPEEEYDDYAQED
jgi:hypothetical protein